MTTKMSATTSPLGEPADLAFDEPQALDELKAKLLARDGRWLSRRYGPLTIDEFRAKERLANSPFGGEYEF